ncbi:phage terminase large subunit [Micromonospora sp. STR1s_5]|nr:phage terminase large subunit [Micromonospora sp. STR1s_5]
MIYQNGWTMLVIPAIAEEDTAHRIGPRPQDVHLRRKGDLLLPERETQEDLDRVRRELGTVNYSDQYQQAPMPPGGAIIKRDWIRRYDLAPRLIDRKIVSWDTASTLEPYSSYSVGTVWASVGLDYYLLSVVRERLEFPDLQRRVLELHRREGADLTIIEKTDIGRALVKNLRSDNLLAPKLVLPRMEKEARLLKHAPRFENGQILLPREAPWLGIYERELLAFPNSEFNDQVDSTTQALDELLRYRAVQRAETEDGMYGPTGRRTRACLTPSRRKPARNFENIHQEPDEPPLPPIVRKVAADYELTEREKPREQADRAWRRPSRLDRI